MVNERAAKYRTHSNYDVNETVSPRDFAAPN